MSLFLPHRRSLALGRGGGVVYTPPAGLGWPSTVNGKSAPAGAIYQGERWVALGAGRTPLDPKTLVSSSIWAATPQYVDPTRADNAGDGLSWAAAKRDINAAITAANGDGAASAMLANCLANDFYHQTRTINGSAVFPSGVQPAKPAGLVASGGRVRHIAGTAEDTWTSAGSGVYTGGPSTALQVFDRLTLDAYGNYVEITARADQAAVVAADEGWADIGVNLAIKRPDGLVPSKTNTLILRNINVAAFNTSTTDLYIEGFDFEGGQFGAGWHDAVTTANLVYRNNTFKYSGEPANLLSAFRARQVNGLVFLEDCEASRGASDGFNFHQDSAVGPMYVFGNRLRAFSNGRLTSPSNNAFTAHDGVIAWVVGLVCGDSYVGSDFHCVENTKTYALGCTVTATTRGGAGNAAVKASNSAIIWLENCVIEAPAGHYALHAQGGTIYHRNCTIIGDTLADAGGSIVAVTGDWP